jgi:hypothetical protein
MQVILDRVSMFLKEILNFLTDLLVPLVDLVIAVATLLPIPEKYIDLMKKGEHYLKQIGDTLEEVNTEVNKRK